MLDREPFLKAIFAAPDDDLPRLVFADYLDEHGDPDWAELIRVQCELARPPAETDRRPELFRRMLQLSDRVDLPWADTPEDEAIHRGFRESADITVTSNDLADPDAIRLRAVTERPEWYGATRLVVTDGTITTPEQLHTALASPVTEHVTGLNLSGRTEEIATEAITLGDGEVVGLTDFVVKPAITVRMVEHLCQMREARRLTSLDLRMNNLDNDALRALVRSPHLIRLERLILSGDNRFKGRVWQQVLDRFGPHRVQ